VFGRFWDRGAGFAPTKHHIVTKNRASVSRPDMVLGRHRQSGGWRGLELTEVNSKKAPRKRIRGLAALENGWAGENGMFRTAGPGWGLARGWLDTGATAQKNGLHRYRGEVAGMAAPPNCYGAGA